MKKPTTNKKYPLLAYAAFGLVTTVIVAGFLTAKTYLQLGLVTAAYPLLAYFAFKLFSGRGWKVQIKKPEVRLQPVPALKPKREKVDVVDIDRRTFLKLIGAAGLTFFTFSIFAKRVESLFFNRLSDAGLTNLDTKPDKAAATASPTDNYRISEIDESDVTFYGFVNNNGEWFIMREDPDDGSFRYARGEADFPGHWKRREGLTYDYFHKVF